MAKLEPVSFILGLEGNILSFLRERFTMLVRQLKCLRMLPAETWRRAM